MTQIPILSNSLEQNLAYVSRNRDRSMAKMVRYVLEENDGKLIKLDDMARAFCISSRTFSRRLKHEGTSYRIILEAVRSEFAKKVLIENDVRISEVSLMLGYSDPSNFIKAFKGWEGCSPKKYRAATNTKCV